MNDIKMSENVCSGRRCDYALYDGSLGCVTGSRTCANAGFLEAGESDFHDENLVNATAALNAVLAMVPEDEEGRKLSFIHTNMGTMLAWSKHGENVPEDAIGPGHDDKVIAEALNLKNVDWDAY